MKKKTSRLLQEHNKNTYIAILLVALVCVAVVWPTATSVCQRIEGRSVLGVAKNIELSIRLLSVEYHGINSRLIDGDSESGFTFRAEQEIRELSGAKGRFYLLNWDEENNQMLHLTYQAEGFLVDIQYEGEKGYTWQVYRLEKIL